MEPQERSKLVGLQLSVAGVTAREKRREALGKRVESPWFVRAPYVGAHPKTKSGGC